MEKRVRTIPPMAVGALGGVVLAGVVLVVAIWFPWLGDDLGRHKGLVQGVYYTVGFFAFFVERLWHWRSRGMFWQSISALLLLHVVGVYLYSTRVQPLLVWQWMILFIPESVIFVSLLNCQRAVSVTRVSIKSDHPLDKVCENPGHENLGTVTCSPANRTQVSMISHNCDRSPFSVTLSELVSRSY
jgi:hypothetical protein